MRVLIPSLVQSNLQPLQIWLVWIVLLSLDLDAKLWYDDLVFGDSQTYRWDSVCTCRVWIIPRVFIPYAV